MSSPTRDEAFFLRCNDSNYLRSEHRITEAYGVLGVSKEDVAKIFESASSIWGDKALPMTIKGSRNERAEATNLLRGEYPELFGIANNGPQEKKFIEVNGPQTFFTLLNGKNQAAKRSGQVEPEATETNTTAENHDGHNGQVPTSAGDEQTSASAEPAEANTEPEFTDYGPSTPTEEPQIPLDKLFYEVRTLRQKIPVFKMHCSYFTTVAGTPSFEGLCTNVNAFPWINWPGAMTFVFITYLADHRAINDQETLDDAFREWRSTYPWNDTFVIYAVDQELPPTPQGPVESDYPELMDSGDDYVEG